MNALLKRSGIVVVAGLVVIQFVHPSHNSGSLESGADISKVVNVPPNVLEMLHRACYDCHSSKTEYPWYSKVQPVDWWLNDHITDGKRHLNFSEFERYPTLKKSHKLEEVADEVKEGGMPLESYTWMHKNARFTPEEKEQLVAWAEGASKEIHERATPTELAEEEKRRKEKEREH